MMWRAFELAFRRLLAQALATDICCGKDNVTLSLCPWESSTWALIPQHGNMGISFP